MRDMAGICSAILFNGESCSIALNVDVSHNQFECQCYRAGTILAKSKLFLQFFLLGWYVVFISPDLSCITLSFLYKYFSTSV